MSNPEHFRSRAAEYRQMALNSQDEWKAGDLFEIASLFDSMAADLTFRLKPAPPATKPLPLAILAWARPAIRVE